MIIKNYR